MTVISNTSPITNLAAIGQLNLLEKIYGRIIIPQAVYQEIAGLGYAVPGTIEVQTLSWIQTETVTNRAFVTQLQTELDWGESEAIALTVELTATRLLLDDLQARIVASRLGLNITGVLGVILIAKSRGLISSVRPVIDDLINVAGFRVSNNLYATILQSAGE
jgi:predicted nucleic acid-binding protein